MTDTLITQMLTELGITDAESQQKTRTALVEAGVRFRPAQPSQHRRRQGRARPPLPDGCVSSGTAVTATADRERFTSAPAARRCW